MKPVKIDLSKGWDTKEIDKLLDNLPMMDEATKIAIKGQAKALEMVEKILSPSPDSREEKE